MDQTKIWDHFQNDDQTGDAFLSARPRYEFIARQIKSGSAALNIGVGRGGLEAILIDKGCVVSCLDPSDITIDRLRKQFGLGERAKVGFSQSMPFPDTQFDIVIMSEVLEHLSEDALNATLIEVRRVLKSGGCFIGTVPANEKLSDSVVACPHCGEAFHRWGHLQSFSPTRLRQLLLRSGFLVVRNETRVFPDWRRSGSINLLKSLMRYFLGRAGMQIASPNIYFEAKK